MKCDRNDENSFPTTQGKDTSSLAVRRKRGSSGCGRDSRASSRVEASFRCVVGKEFLAFPSHLKRRRSPQERREELQGRATIPRVPQMSQSIPGKTFFPALSRLSSRGSTHSTVARGTALWESLVGKPSGKASRESHRSLDPREGKRDSAARAREESARACPHSRQVLTPLGRLQKNP